MFKKYIVYYTLVNDSRTHVVLSTDDINNAIECYSTFIFDNYLSKGVYYCALRDTDLGKCILFTDWCLNYGKK